MPWARFDDHMPTHRKIRPLSDAAFRLWVSAVCWCNANRTDGIVFCQDLTYVSDTRRPKKAMQELVASGLWEEIEGGWYVHDFHDYNPSKDQVDAQRELKTARQRRWRSNQNPDAVDASTDASTDASVTHLSRARVPSRPDPTPINTSPASAAPHAEPTATAKPAKPKRPTLEHPDQWERFWNAYPRKKDKGAAERAWNKAIRDGADPNTILDGVLFYRLDCATKDAQFIKYPATWLNARGWQDEPDPQPKAPSPIGAPSEATAAQPRPFAEIRHEFRRADGIDFGDPFSLPD